MDNLQMERFIAAAQPRYNAELPYHNWEHAQAVMEALKEVLSRMERRGTRFAQRNALIVAAAWHDADWGGAYREHGFDCEEAYAAHLATKYLRANAANEEDIAFIAEAILATRHNTTRRSLSGVALHYADVKNIGSDYRLFLDANRNLYREAAVLGAPINEATHKERTTKFVTFTIEEARREFGRLGERVGTPNSFDAKATANLARYQQEPLT